MTVSTDIEDRGSGENQTRNEPPKKKKSVIKPVLLCLLVIIVLLLIALGTKEKWDYIFDMMRTFNGKEGYWSENIDGAWVKDGTPRFESTDKIMVDLKFGGKGVLIIGDQEYPFTFKHTEDSIIHKNFSINFESDDPITVQLKGSDGRMEFTVTDPDSCMLLYDKSYGSLRFSFQTDRTEADNRFVLSCSRYD